MHVTARILVQLLVVAENHDGHVDRAEDGQLVGLLEQSPFTLEECPTGETRLAMALAMGGSRDEKSIH